MTVLSVLLSSLIATSIALSDFRVTFQLTGSSSRTRDGAMVKTDCFSDRTNTYSDWAYGPVTGMGGMKIGLEKCTGRDITNKDMRLCVQVASNKKEGTKTCTDWASDGAGGWSDFAQTVDNEHIYKARVMVETKSATDLVLKDIEAGIRATDVNKITKDANNPTLWGKPAWTGYLSESGEHGVYTKASYANTASAPIKAAKVYFQADTGVQYCCTLTKGQPRDYQTCASEIRAQGMTVCENNTEGGPECKWTDCTEVGYCKWDAGLGRAQKGKQTCGTYMSMADCNGGYGGRSGCQWTSGAPPEWYQMDYDYNKEEKVDMNMFKSDIKSMRLLRY